MIRISSVAVASLMTVGNAFVKEEIAMISGDFDDKGRLNEAFWKEPKHVKAVARGEEYVCSAEVGSCMLPAHTTCFLTQVQDECDGVNIYTNGSKGVRIGKGPNCDVAVRCLHIPVGEDNTDYFTKADTNESDFPKAEYTGIAWMGFVSGPFRTDLRSKQFVKPKPAKVSGSEYSCESKGNNIKKCALPSYGTCFLTHISGNGQCAVKMNNSKDVFLMAKDGSCKVRCYMLNTWSGMWVNEIQPVSSMKLIFGDFDTSEREEKFTTAEFVKPELERHGRVVGEYGCLSVGEKKCMLPSNASCFLTYFAPIERSCEIVDNGGNSPYVHAKKGNCNVRCFMFEYIYESGVGRRLLASLSA